jgi:hypothetical protein
LLSDLPFYGLQNGGDGDPTVLTLDESKSASLLHEELQKLIRDFWGNEGIHT